MARIRLLNPKFFTDGKICSLPPLTRLLFQGLWCEADREGRLVDSPVDFKIRLLPLDSVDIEAALSALAGVGLIDRYEVEGRRILSIRNFSRYQKPHQNEAKSQLPGFIDGASASTIGASTSSDGESARAVTVTVTVTDPTTATTEKTPTDTAVNEVLALAIVDAEVHKAPAEKLREIWNEAKPKELPPWLKTGPSRLKTVKARLAEEPDLEVWRKAIASLAGSGFHLGQNDRKWRANPDWLLRPDTLTKLLEANHTPPTPTKPAGSFGGPSLVF